MRTPSNSSAAAQAKARRERLLFRIRGEFFGLRQEGMLAEPDRDALAIAIYAVLKEWAPTALPQDSIREDLKRGIKQLGRQCAQHERHLRHHHDLAICNWKP